MADSLGWGPLIHSGDAAAEAGKDSLAHLAVGESPTSQERLLGLFAVASARLHAPSW